MDPNDPFKKSFGGKNFSWFISNSWNALTDNIGSMKKKGTLPPMENKPNQENILNAILPPREWVENGKHYIQYVSHQQATRVDVARLREMLD